MIEYKHHSMENEVIFRQIKAMLKAYYFSGCNCMTRLKLINDNPLHPLSGYDRSSLDLDIWLLDQFLFSEKL